MGVGGGEKREKRRRGEREKGRKGEREEREKKKKKKRVKEVKEVKVQERERERAQRETKDFPVVKRGQACSQHSKNTSVCLSFHSYSLSLTHLTYSHSFSLCSRSPRPRLFFHHFPQVHADGRGKTLPGPGPGHCSAMQCTSKSVGE